MNQYDVLKTYFGYDEFRGGQKALIDHILAGQDVVGIMPTGAGKSICYQIPALLMDGMTLVISPLISLMQDQVGALIQNDIPAAFVNSSLSTAQYHKVLERIKENQYKIIYVAPERLGNDAFLQLMKTVKLSMISVDEAHCISHWGQDFRPSYLKIKEFVDQLSVRPVISAFTATATTQVKEDIIASLELQDPFTLTTGFDRKNLYFEVRHPKHKDEAVCKFLLEHKGESGIIYCSTRKQVEAIYGLIKRQGISVGMYHAGLSEALRKQVQDEFLFDQISIMVATNAFGMGIDKSNVAFVLHYAMPKDMESYYQEAGRAGRDGSAASCILFYSPKDVKMNQFLIEVSSQQENDMDPDLQKEVRRRDEQRLKLMTFYCHSDECLRHYILHYFGEESDSYCGNCYNCTHNFETVDITTEAQKILSCILRLQERFGITMVIDVLRGSKNDRLLRLHLDEVSTYGIMKEVSAKRIREIINYLQYHGYILSSGSEYPVLKVSATAKDILTKHQTLEMKVTKEKEIKTMASAKIPSHVDPMLLARLKSLRAKIAKQQHVPAYIIFNDASLFDMCKIRPTTPQEFLLVSGVGEAKLKRYGTAFLQEIQDFQANEFVH